MLCLARRTMCRSLVLQTQILSICRDGYGEDRREKLTTSDALGYLREVKNRFANNKKVYDSFLDIMKQFKAQT